MKKDLQSRYRDAYSNLGRPLKRRDGIPVGQLKTSSRKLGIEVPIALADYYRVAGRVADLHSAHDRILLPEKWWLDRKTLVFMEENQAVVLYGVKLAEGVKDPPVVMAANHDPLRWLKVCASTSEFLLTMLHWEVAFGGAMPTGGTAQVAQGFRRRLDREWKFVGEVNHMRAYARPGIALCYVRWEPHWRVFIGAVTEEKLQSTGAELGVKLQTEIGFM